MINKKIKGFEWDDKNINHISKHNVIPEEVQEVFIEKVLVRVTGNDRRIALGKTVDGRYLKVVYVNKEQGMIRVITALNMSDRDKKYYKREKGG